MQDKYSKILQLSKVGTGAFIIIYTERLFVRINRKSGSYFSIISFQSEASRVYVSEINIVVFKGQS